MTTARDELGNILYAYTRKEAVAAGEQIDLFNNPLAKEAGFVYPVFITRAVWESCVLPPSNKPSQDQEGRLWDVLWVLRGAIRRTSQANSGRIQFAVSVITDKGRRQKNLLAAVGPVDINDPRPAITIMYPEEN